MVVSLGNAALPETEKSAIARAVENRLAGFSELLPAELSEETVGWVRRILQLAARSKSARPVGSQTMDVLVGERVSPWALSAWTERPALPELLDVRITKRTKVRLDHDGDVLCARGKAIEAGLRRREAELFDAVGSIVLYDMTNTHFEELYPSKTAASCASANPPNQTPSRHSSTKGFPSTGKPPSAPANPSPNLSQP